VNLLDLLRKLGDRLGILEAAAGPQAGVPARIQTQSVTLAELMTKINRKPIHALAGAADEFSVAFARIFEAAGIRPPAGSWTVERLQQLTHCGEFKALNKSAAQRKLLEILRAENAEARELVKEAVARDRALDEFEKSLRQTLDKKSATAERRIAELHSKIQDLERERADLQERFQDWLGRKRAYEAELAHAVGYLIGESVISIDGEPGH